MDAVLTSLRPQARHTTEDDFDGTGLEDYGNLTRSGGVRGMSIPRVPDVSSIIHTVHLKPLTSCSSLNSMRQLASVNLIDSSRTGTGDDTIS